MVITNYIYEFMVKYRHYTPVPYFVLTIAHTFLGTVLLTISTLLQSHTDIQYVHICILSLLVLTLCLAQI